MNVGIVISRGLSKLKQLPAHESLEGNPSRPKAVAPAILLSMAVVAAVLGGIDVAA